MPGNKPLDARLSCVASLVIEAVRGAERPAVADVGCDHGYLSAHLLEALPGASVLACDVSAPSLEKARKLLAQRGLTERARFAVADGLAAVGVPPDAVVLAGMGAHTILRIVREGRERLRGAALIAQANTGLPQLRAGLAQMGFVIQKEAYAEAGGRRYAALIAREGEARALSPREAFLGAAADGARDAAQRDYLLWLRAIRIEESRQAARAASAEGRERLAQGLEQIRWIEEALGMKTITAKELEALVGEIAPYELAEEWDNVGLLAGREGREISRVLVALDVTRETLLEAKALGAQAIVTHHPMMFHARKRLTDADREGRLLLELAREDIALIAAHTNLDAAPGGVNDTLMRAMGCGNIRGEGCVRAGDLPQGTTLGTLARRAQDALHAAVRVYGAPDMSLRVLGCCSGAGGSELAEARALGADCFITGEIRHHEALDAVDSGVCVIEAGHYETENPVCEVLCTALQKKLDALQYTVTVYRSQANPFGRDQ